ncbi:MAG: endonuclease/exonuclease/phosphatase family protein [Flavobacteriaceae bacterium]
MKKLSAINKFLYIVNIIIALFLAISYLLPYVSPKSFPSLAVISLGVPILIMLNLLFVIYWLVQLKKALFISLIILLLGFNYMTSLFLISGKDIATNNDLKVMSYNVKGFNHLGWKKRERTKKFIIDFIKTKNIDVLVIQEYLIATNNDFGFEYQFVKTKNPKNRFGQAIFSNHPIIASGSLDFKESNNNGIYVDLIVELDTVRIYNIHLESLKVNPSKENFGEENSEKLYQRIKNTFSKQAYQTETVVNHKKQWKGKTIVCSDLNNTAYSWVYNELSNDMKDAFLEAGKGFGKTYDYPFPLRIDFIFTDEKATVNHFKIFDIKNSDHFPIMTHLNWK